MTNKIKKINASTFTASERAINKIFPNYVLVGNKRKFKDYGINDTGTIFATDLLKTTDDFFNSVDVLKSIYGFGKQAHLILKNDLITNMKKISSQNDLNEDEEIKFISYNELNNNVSLSNSFVDSFIPYDIFIAHIEELKPLLLDFCRKNGLPYVDFAYFNTNKLSINPEIINFCQKNNICLFDEKIILDSRVKRFCENNNISYIDISKFDTTGKLYINPLVVEFCVANNIPYPSLKNKKINSRIIKFCEANNINLLIENVQKGYYCNSKPFVSLSIIIYILFETQDIIKKIIENAPSDKKPKSYHYTLAYISDAKNYKFNENNPNLFLKNLKPILWFFYGNKDINFRNLNIYELAQFVTQYYELIEKQTSYIKFTSVPRFFFSENKFGIEEMHENLLSVAWSRLKLSMFSNRLKICNTPDCNNIIDSLSPNEQYCEYCIIKKNNLKVNSRNSYYKKQNLHKKLVELYNSTEKSKLDALDKDKIKQIKEYISYSTASLIKNNTKITKIQEYIDLLSNL